MRKSLLPALLLQPCFVLIGAAVLAQARVDTASATSSTPAGSLINDVAALETKVYGKPTSDPLAARVGHLELSTLGNQQSGPLRARVDWLQHELQKPYSVKPITATNEQREPLRLSPDIEQRIPAAFRTQLTPHPAYVGSEFTAAAAREMGMHQDACACHFYAH